MITVYLGAGLAGLVMGGAIIVALHWLLDVPDLSTIDRDEHSV